MEKSNPVRGEGAWHMTIDDRSISRGARYPAGLRRSHGPTEPPRLGSHLSGARLSPRHATEHYRSYSTPGILKYAFRAVWCRSGDRDPICDGLQGVIPAGRDLAERWRIRARLGLDLCNAETRNPPLARREVKAAGWSFGHTGNSAMYPPASHPRPSVNPFAPPQRPIGAML